ncbi:MAG TPA: homoserine kinase [Phnomibacter sp.]|nr:homoserine kinase [Phnomibacter sp.]
MKRITVQAPATVSNLGSGFDVLGFAMHEPYDTMHLQLIDEPVIRILQEKEFGISSDPSQNVAGRVLMAVRERRKMKEGFELVINKTIMPGSGIGSSAASAAGAAFAANALLGNIFSKNEMVELAMEGEVVASGSKHADNVAPCIYGGVTLIRSIDPLDIISIPPANVFVTVVHPQIEIKTSYARSVLRKEVPMKDAVKQWGNLGALIAGFFMNDLPLIGRSLEDVIAEPYRKGLIPGYDEVKQRSLAAGALGGCISGSGPSVFMFSESREVAERVGAEMGRVYVELGIDHHIYVTTINDEGVRII